MSPASAPTTIGSGWPKLRSFARRHGTPQVLLAMHAGLPLGLTPELLNLIRVNFVPRAHYIVEADLLLSDLVRDLGGGLFEFEPDIRRTLLRQMRSRYGLEGVRRVADFLYTFSDLKLQERPSRDVRDFYRAQQWTALSFLAPEKTAEELAKALKEGLDRRDGGEIRRVIGVSRALAGQLGGMGGVVRYAVGLERLLDQEGAEALTGFEALGETGHRHRVGQVELPAADELASTVGEVRPTELSVLGEPESEEDLPEPDAAPDEVSAEAAQPSFDIDVYISYAHIDNQAPSEGEDGWITTLHETLQVRLAQLMGREVRIVLDFKLQGSDVFADQIAERLSDAAVFLPVLSPRYVESLWCLRELGEFVKASEASGGPRIGQKSRVFKVVKTPTAMEDHPPEVRELLGYDFYDIDDETGRPREFYPAVFPETQRQFLSRLDDLAHDIRGVLERLAGMPSETEAPVAGPSGHVVLSYAHEDRDVAVAIRDGLEERGLDVWDDSAIKPGDKWHEEIDKALQRSKVAVLLVSQNFAASDFILDEELPYILESARLKSVLLLWIAVSSAPFDHIGLGEFQALNDPNKPLDSLGTGARNRELLWIYEKIKAAVTG